MSNDLEPQRGAVIIGGALQLVRARYPVPAVAFAAATALQTIRRTVLEQAGYGSLRQFDDWLNERRTERAGASRQSLTADIDPQAPGAGAAGTILADAAGSCLILNAHAQGNGLLLTGAVTLLDALIQAVGGVPDRAALDQALERASTLDETLAGNSDAQGGTFVMLQ